MKTTSTGNLKHPFRIAYFDVQRPVFGINCPTRLVILNLIRVHTDFNFTAMFTFILAVLNGIQDCSCRVSYAHLTVLGFGFLFSSLNWLPLSC